MLGIFQKIAYELYPNTEFSNIDLEYLTSQLLKKHNLTELRKMDGKTMKTELTAITDKL